VIARRGRGSFVPCFTLALRSDDTAVIEEIAARLGFGRVYQVVQKTAGRPDRYRVEWKVNTKADVVAFATFLRRFPLRSKKARDASLWLEAVDLWANREGHRGKGREPHPVQVQLRELKRTMEEDRRFAA